MEIDNLTEEISQLAEEQVKEKGGVINSSQENQNNEENQNQNQDENNENNVDSSQEQNQNQNENNENNDDSPLWILPNPPQKFDDCFKDFREVKINQCQAHNQRKQNEIAVSQKKRSRKYFENQC